jgi:predicted metal-binding protein
MLILLKNKQHKIASVTLSMFVGSWLLLLCQTCLAAVDDINDHSKPTTELSNSCHAFAIDEPTNEKNNVHNELCLGACEFDDISVTVNSEKSSDINKKIKYSPDSYAYVVPQITLSNRASPTYRILAIPERAIFLPLQQYTVLLI